MEGVKGMDIQYRFQESENTWMVRLIGEVDIYNAPQLKDSLLNLLNERQGNIILDCRELKYIDSTGLGVLISALKKAKEFNGSIKITNLKPYIYKIFSITGLDKIFTIEVQGA